MRIAREMKPMQRLCFVVLMTWAASSSAAEFDAEQIAFFETKIRPIFVRHCYQCHSQDADDQGKLKGKLRLDTRSGLLRGGESGAAAESVAISFLRK